MSDQPYATLTQLGRPTTLPASPAEATLERVPSPNRGAGYVVRFTAPEFTSLCPLTAQPDFAHIVIDYIPGDWLVESKSLKLFLGSFRNHGAFHEACTMEIAGPADGAAVPGLAADRGVLVSARRHPDRRVLADRARRRRAPGCRTRAWPPTVAAADPAKPAAYATTRSRSGSTR